MDAVCSARQVKGEAMCAGGLERGVNARHAAEKNRQNLVLCVGTRNAGAKAGIG
jgi:hypothetical protein